MDKLAAEELLFKLIAQPSISNSEGPYAATLAELLSAEGLSVEVDEHNNVYAFDDAAPRVVFSTHIDTVPPFIEPRLDGRVMFGRGACDTKGGFVAQLLAYQKLKAEGFSGLGFVLVVNEETDHSGARIAIQHAAMDRLKTNDGEASAQIILCEPTQNQIVSAQKGLLKIRLKYTGKAAHSAYPERGFSAIHDMIPELNALLELNWPTDPRLGPTTLNVGEIEGGVAANVFAPSAAATLMIRLTRPVGEVQPLVEAAVKKGQIEVISAMDPVFYEPPENYPTRTVSFNTDAAILSEIAPVWLCGPGDIEVAHSDHEHIDLDEMHAGAELYADLARFLFSNG